MYSLDGVNWVAGTDLPSSANWSNIVYSDYHGL
jgi:hypothetical protein